MLFISNWGFMRPRKLLGPILDQNIQKLRKYIEGIAGTKQERAAPP